MNRFNQIIDQQYVPMPFQEVMAAAAVRQKAGQDTQEALGNAQGLLSKFQAIPKSVDDEYRAQAEKAANDLISSYTSDPHKLYSPNSVYNFKRDFSQAIDINRLQKGQTSYEKYLSDIDNQKSLQAQGKFKPELVPTGEGWDSRKGIYNQFTPAYSKSLDTTGDYIRDYKPHASVDPVTGVATEYVDPKDLYKLAEYWHTNYMNTTSFKNELALAQKMGDPDAADPSTLAKKILIKDWFYKLRDLQRGGWKPSDGKKGSGDKEKEAKVPTDWGFDRITNPDSVVGTTELDALGLPVKDYKFGDKQITANTVKFDAENTINSYANILRPKDAVQSQAFDAIQELQAAYKDVASHVGGIDIKTYTNWNWLDGGKQNDFIGKYPVDRQPTEDDIKYRNSVFQRTIAAKEKLKAAMGTITGKDYSKVNFVDPNQREAAFKDVLKAAGLQGKFKNIDDAANSVVQLGTALDQLNNGNTGPFVPTSGKGNKTYEVGEDGTYKMRVNGTRYVTKEELNLAFKNTAASNKIFSEDWEDKFGEGGAKLIKEVSPGMYAVPTSISIPITDDSMDKINTNVYSKDQLETNTPINHANRQAIAQDRLRTSYAGQEVLADLPTYTKEINDFMANTDEGILRGSGYTKARLNKEFKAALGSGDPFKIGEFARKVNSLNSNNKIMDALGAVESPDGSHVLNPKSNAVGSHQVVYSVWKDLFKQHGLDGGNAEKTLEKVKKDPSEYKALVSDLINKIKPVADNIYNSYDGPEIYSQTDMLALTYFLGPGNLQTYLGLLKDNDGNESMAWSQMPSKVTDGNVQPSKYLSIFNKKLNT